MTHNVQDQCRLRSAEPMVRIPLPGRAFHAVSTQDGCWVFASMQEGPDSGMGGVAVVSLARGVPALARAVSGPPRVGGSGRPPATFGLALTHDDRVLIVARGDRLIFYDVARLTSGAPEPLLGTLQSEGNPAGYFHMAIAADDRILLAANHNYGQASITVVDLAEARRSAFRTIRVIGKIPTGEGPSSIAVSADGRRFFATAQIADTSWHWPTVCRPPGSAPTATPTHARGAVYVIDAARAAVDPGHSVIATTAAGCDPVRLVVSPMSNRAYVTANRDNALLAFDTERLVSDSAHALVGTVATRPGPVGVAVLDGGRRIAVTNSFRLVDPRAVGGDSEVVMLIDASVIASSQNAVIGTIPSGGGPLDLTLTRDGSVLLVPNFEPRALTFIQIRRALAK
jgi:DNA-binding beta-propeller fold protein YncE